jgi:hypothetical protein
LNDAPLHFPFAFTGFGHFPFAFTSTIFSFTARLRTEFGSLHPLRNRQRIAAFHSELAKPFVIRRGPRLVDTALYHFLFASA